MKKIVSALFTISLILTGCGIESIFDGHFIEWGFLFLLTVAFAVMLGGEG